MTNISTMYSFEKVIFILIFKKTWGFLSVLSSLIEPIFVRAAVWSNCVNKPSLNFALFNGMPTKRFKRHSVDSNKILLYFLVGFFITGSSVILAMCTVACLAIHISLVSWSEQIMAVRSTQIAFMVVKHCK